MGLHTREAREYAIVHLQPTRLAKEQILVTGQLWQILSIRANPESPAYCDLLRPSSPKHCNLVVQAIVCHGDSAGSNFFTSNATEATTSVKGLQSDFHKNSSLQQPRCRERSHSLLCRHCQGEAEKFLAILEERPKSSKKPLSRRRKPFGPFHKQFVSGQLGAHGIIGVFVS